VKAKGVATEIRRKTLDELKTATYEGDSIAAQFARILNEQPLAGYGQVAWQVLPSGKIQSSKPNFQSVPDEEGKLESGHRTRSQIVMEAALPHEVQFVRLDIKRAEPSLILHDLGMPTNLDLYRLFMDGTGEKDRQRAKSAVNALAYCKAWVHRSKAMPEALLPYCEALQVKRESVKREADRTGFVTTLTGRKISRQEGKVHAGQIYNKRIAGTVADIVNDAGLNLTGFGCRCWPVSDALYVLAPETVDVEGIFKAGIASKGFARLSIEARVTDIASPRVVNRVPAKDSITPFHPDNLSLPRTEALSLPRTA
jgi:hypothetical protein